MWFTSGIHRRKNGRKVARDRRVVPQVEHLEDRTLLSVTLDVGPNVNTSRLPFNQQEVTIAINPTNPSNLFIASNSRNLHQVTPPQTAQFAAYSMNGGKTWKYVDPKDGTVGDGDDDLPTTTFDTSAAFDSFGNLFWAYLNKLPDGTHKIAVVLSTDGGKSFSTLALLQSGHDTDHPILVIGPGPGGSGSSVWVSYVTYSPNQIVVQGASVTGLGAVGTFNAPEVVSGSGTAINGPIAVGPDGQVMLTYQNPFGQPDSLGNQNGRSRIITCLDPDGLGPAGFSTGQALVSLNLSADELIAAQPHQGVDAEPMLAYDRSSGPHRGRVYAVYTDAVANGSDDLDNFVRFSDDNGGAWSNPVRVNDDTGTNSQFLPRIALDQTTGYIAVSWYDCRNDLGTGGPGDRDGIPNDDTQFWATVSTDGGLSFVANVRVSAGTSSANAAWTGINQDYGDYTGLDFYGGKFYPAWADNSNSTGDNPPGAFHYFDIYTAGITVTVTDAPRLTAASTAPRSIGRALVATQAQPLLREARARYQATGVNTSGLGRIQIQVSDLGGRTLGMASGHTIWLDANAAGWGWFVDPTPGDDRAVTTPDNLGAQSRRDLLTVLEHEIGHLLGREHEADGLMAATRMAVTRRVPALGSDLMDMAALAPVFADGQSSLAAPCPAESILPILHGEKQREGKEKA
jgi:hypothetical protein